MNAKKVALVVGSFMALVHLIWAIVVALNLGQVFLDFIFNLHSLSNAFTVLPFSLARSLGLIIVTFVLGYIFGWIFAWVWNKVHK